MKCKILRFLPYVAALIFLMWGSANIEHSIKMHLGYEFYYVLPYGVAFLYSVIAGVIAIIKKDILKFDFLLPLVLFAIGKSFAIMGAGVPCCSGG